MNNEHLIPTANVVNEPVCGDCVHCQPGPRTKEDIMSRACYRFPPTAFGVLTQQGIAVMSVRPEIRVDTIACGEFETADEEEPQNSGLTS